ncbi:arsenate reductase family protein [Candidatus Protochlamydia phocaeensis]|uniref:arsenate reductase family protein n=1 Tax=Candidatus Protochlamydia phocaeensis TaxID=1414722 RepID=UPI001E60EE78|nr:arsenate reductase family protein [Candidatus Protochlamydia phocaeensis]
MMMKVYVYSKCSTCQKALSFLAKNNVSFVRKEITDEPPSIQELQAMLRHVNGNIKKLFNSSGQLYRDMNMAEKIKDLPQPDALALLSQHGMLIKRPFLIGENSGLVGFNEAEWASLLNSG